MNAKKTSKPKKAVGSKRVKPKARAEAPSNDQVEPLDKGPGKWLVPVLESAYSRLIPREEEMPEQTISRAETKAIKAIQTRTGISGRGAKTFTSVLQPGRGEEILQDVPRDYWVQRLLEYKQRRVASVAPEPTLLPGAPAVTGKNNWVPIGPTVVAGGQAIGRPAVGGRVARLAIAPGGNLMYAATANGGVFRSDNAGRSWFSTMDGFDMDPTNFASTSLACGAIAIDPTNPDRVYVGTGEGDTDVYFSRRLIYALPSYRGIGPIRSDDGGITWVPEASVPSLAGYAFYELAVDAGNPDHVIAATTNGLYQRTISGGIPTWQQRRTGKYCSIVAARSGSVTTFYAAPWGGPVYRSTDGSTWSVAGTGFPSASVGRISLGVQSDNPNVLYALVANSAGGFLGIYRLDGGAGPWQAISGAPDILPTWQGDYDLCIAVDPNNANCIYAGGSLENYPPYPANIQRCLITRSGATYSMSSTSIGGSAHADVHTLVFPPGDSTRLWAGTDGGCFLNSDPVGWGWFEARNLGLSCLCADYMGICQSAPALIYCGLQDNGTVRYTGEEVWQHIFGGDGGYCVVHPTNPWRALIFANGWVYKTTTGGSYGEWSPSISPAWSLMIEPLVGAPGTERVAFGAGDTVYISDDFGDTWPAAILLPAGSGGIYSLSFVTETRLFIGTTSGRVFRCEQVDGVWSSFTRLDDIPTGPLPLTGAAVSDIAADPTDPTLNSIYICFGGTGDRRHVWQFNGTAWNDRSGSGATGLIDVEHNAMVVDPMYPTHIYVGANIGLWRSTDGGHTWDLLQNGLPDAPVFDLQIHTGTRILRAATHGRGLYEYRLEAPPVDGVELYLRDTLLDTARGENTDGYYVPSKWPPMPTYHFLSPNIKVDTPTPIGYQTPTDQIDFFEFHERIWDGGIEVAAIEPPQIIHNRVYVLVHNRGPFPVAAARVTAVVTGASTVLPALPIGYTANIQSGMPLPSSDWTTLGVVTLNNIQAGFPQVAAFDLPSHLLPMPASLPGQSHFCLVAFVHSSGDPYTATEQRVDALTIQERKVAQRNLHVVQFVVPPPSTQRWMGMWARLEIAGSMFEESGLTDLIFDLQGFPGTLGLVIPNALYPHRRLREQKEFLVKSNALVRRWYILYSREAERLFYEGKYSVEDYARLKRAMKRVAQQPLLTPRFQQSITSMTRIPLGPQYRHTIFLRIDAPPEVPAGFSWEFSVIQRDSISGRIQGGAKYLVQIKSPPFNNEQASGAQLASRKNRTRN